MRVARSFIREYELFVFMVYMTEEETRLLKHHFPSPTDKYEIVTIRDDEFLIKPADKIGGTSLYPSTNKEYFMLRQSVSYAKLMKHKTGYKVRDIPDQGYVTFEDEAIRVKVPSDTDFTTLKEKLAEPVIAKPRKGKQKKEHSVMTFEKSVMIEAQKPIESKPEPVMHVPAPTLMAPATVSTEIKRLGWKTLVNLINEERKKVGEKNCIFSLTPEGFLEVLIKYGPE